MLKDFKVGWCVPIFGRVFRIVDCDDFTRRYYEQVLHKLVGHPEEIPIGQLDQFLGARLKLVDHSRKISTPRNGGPGCEGGILLI